jgi:hypothetical protein
MPVTLHIPAFELTPVEINRWSAIPVAIAVDLVREKGQIDPALRPLRPAGSNRGSSVRRSPSCAKPPISARSCWRWT